MWKEILSGVKSVKLKGRERGRLAPPCGPRPSIWPLPLISLTDHISPSKNNRLDLVLSINCRPWLEAACEKIPWKKGEHIWACFDKGDTKHRVKTNCFPTGNVLCVLGTPAQTYHHGRSYQHRNMLPLYQLLTNVKNKLANLTDNSKRYICGLFEFLYIMYDASI